MSTLANQTAVPVPALTLVKGNNNTASSQNSGSLTQGGMNPSAAAMLILYQVMGMYSKITGINAQEQKTQIQAQKHMGKAEADATIAAGIASGVSMIVGACVEFAMSFVGAVIQGVASTSKYKANSDKTAELETEIKPAQSIDKLDSNVSDGATSADNRVQERATQLKQGRYKTEEDIDETVDEAAIKHLRNNDDDYQEFRNRLDERLGTFEKARNTLAMSSNTQEQMITTYANTINTLGKSGNSISQGTGTMYKAQDDANASSSALCELNGSANGEFSGQCC